MTATTMQPAQNMVLAQPGDFTREQVELIKATVAQGTTDLELQLFLEVCRSTGLNPFQRQVYAIKRGKGDRAKMTIQTGIDGYRLIAARSGTHLGTTDPEFGPYKDGYPEWARVVVRKLVHGHIAEFPATARWGEYVQMKDEWINGRSTGKQIVSEMWARMPHTMLGKCAEALALRKAFPAELSGVYSDVEMEQADSGPQQPQEGPSKVQQESNDAEREKALQAWAVKIGKAGTRLTELGARERAAEVLKGYQWRTDPAQAQAAYEALCAIGVEIHDAQQAQAAVSEFQSSVAPKDVPPFPPQGTRQPDPNEPIGPARAAQLHKQLGVVVKDSTYQGKHDLFCGEAVGREVKHLQDLTNAEYKLVQQAIEDFEAEKAAAGV